MATVEAARHIREVINKLQEVAAQLPDGLDSEVEIHICNGHDAAGLRTTSIEINWVSVLKGGTLLPERSVAQIQGHPHRDEGSGQTTPIMSQIDDLVEEWATVQQDTGDQPGSEDIIRVKTDDEEYVLLPWSEDTYLKLPYVNGMPLLPGAPKAT